MSHCAIVTNELTKRFSDVLGVDCVNLRVKPGELYGFLGFNGVGKAATIRALLGLFSVAAGPRQELVEIDKVVLVVLIGLIGIVATFKWWRMTDQTR